MAINKMSKTQHGYTEIQKKRLWHRCFPVNFGKYLRTKYFIAKFLGTPFLTEHLPWLLLVVGRHDYLNTREILQTQQNNKARQINEAMTQITNVIKRARKKGALSEYC